MVDSERAATPTRVRLSRETITAGAIDLADAEGLDAVTIRRLAQHHGVTPTALYWHFKDKDELLDGIAERLFAEVKLPEEASGTPWPEQMRAVLEGFLAVLRPHPTVAPLLPERVLSSRAGLAVTERTLSRLRQAGLSPERAAETGGVLLSAVVALVTAEPGRHLPAQPEEREDAVRVKRASLTALPPRHFPTVVASADSLSDCASPDDYYAFGLDMLIGGVVTLADRLSR